MKHQSIIRPPVCALVAAFATAGVFAQSPAAPTAPPGTGPAVMTDVAPLPAEDRESVGAIVIDKRPPSAVMGNVGTTTRRILDKAERDKLRDAAPPVRERPAAAPR